MTQRYTFLMEEFDEETGETSALVERTVDTDYIDDVREAFLLFLWNCTFSYVEDVEIHNRPIR